jgi:hypothetical protein
MTDEELTTRDLARRPATRRSAGVDEASVGTEDVDRVTDEDDTYEDVDTGGAIAHGATDQQEPLFPADQAQRLAERWQEIQASFVDQPRASVEQADTLVADLMQRLAATFSDERERLEGQWDSGGDVSTEDLRVALTRYRSFFDRLLAV